MKKVKPLQSNHTSPAKKGMGDYYGSGIRNPIGKPRDVFSEKAPKAQNIGKAPKSLA